MWLRLVGVGTVVVVGMAEPVPVAVAVSAEVFVGEGFSGHGWKASATDNIRMSIRMFERDGKMVMYELTDRGRALLAAVAAQGIAA